MFIWDLIGRMIGAVTGRLFRLLRIENSCLGCLGVFVAPIAAYILLMIALQVGGGGITLVLFLVIVAAFIGGWWAYLKKRGIISGSSSSSTAPGVPDSVAESNETSPPGGESGALRNGGRLGSIGMNSCNSSLRRISQPPSLHQSSRPCVRTPDLSERSREKPACLSGGWSRRSKCPSPLEIRAHLRYSSRWAPSWRARTSD